MKEKIKNIFIGDVVVLAFSLVLLLGTKFVFHACGPKEDGTFMRCHTAETAVLIVAAISVLVAFVQFFVNDRKIKAFLSETGVVLACVAAAIPGRIFSLCMMEDMYCQAVMKPAVTVVSVLLILGGVVNAVLNIRSSRVEYSDEDRQKSAI